MDSGCHELSEIYGLYRLTHHIVEISGDVTDAGRQTTREDRATQLVICETLSRNFSTDVVSCVCEKYHVCQKDPMLTMNLEFSRPITVERRNQPLPKIIQ